jgi:hypothetical protein
MFNVFLVPDDPVKTSIIVAMDFPVNNSTHHLRERKEIAKKYSIPHESQVVMVTKSIMQMNLVTITMLRTSLNSLLATSMVRCDVCSGFARRSSMLCGCSLGHMCCAHHLIPFDRSALNCSLL